MADDQGCRASSPECVMVEDVDELYRRILPQWTKIEDGKRVVSSGAFHSHTDPEPSVDLARLTSPAESLKGYPDHELAGFFARSARLLGLDVVHTPYPEYDPDNYAHCLIKGLDSLSGNGKKKAAKDLARSCHFVAF